MADMGHEMTDAKLAALEKRLREVFQEAASSAAAKYNKHMASLAVKDEKHKKDVAEGRWTQEEYENWRKNQMLVSGVLAETRDTIAEDLHNADKLAQSMIYTHRQDVYALNHNYGTFQVEKAGDCGTSYAMYDIHTVQRLVRDNPDLLPKPSARRQAEIDAKDIQWNRQKLQSAITASILAGDSIPATARRLQTVAAMDYRAAKRAAQTATTGAECGGRLDSYKRAADMGIKGKKKWSSMGDSHVRESHQIADGQEREIKDAFNLTYGDLLYPGDPSGPPAEVYNCRCTLEYVFKGFDKEKLSSDVSQDAGTARMSFREWANRQSDGEESKIEWPKKGERISRTEYRKLMQYGRDAGVRMSGFKFYEGDPAVIRDAIDSIKTVGAKYPRVFEGKNPVTLVLEGLDDNDAFAETIGTTIRLNPNAYRSKKRLVEEYQEGVDSGFFTKGTDYRAIAIHELGHVVSNVYGIDILKIAEEIIGTDDINEIRTILKTELSEYSTKYADGTEIISESFASAYGSKTPCKFALLFVKKYRNVAIGGRKNDVK